MRALEAFQRPFPSPARVLADVVGVYFANGLIGFIFAATGPLAIILSVGSGGGLSSADLASWIFGAFFVNGLLSIGFCWFYRQPLVFFWTIPGTVLVGPALAHLSYAEVIGAFLACGVLMLVLGLTGVVGRLMRAVPMPIVMGMVAGVFMKFGLDLIFAIRDDFALAATMSATFVVLSALPAAGRRMPPLIGALIAGALVIAFSGGIDPTQAAGAVIASPNLYRPVFSWQAMIELVVPLAITVLIVQNGQGFAVLDAVGHRAPVNAVTTACGAWSILTGAVGCASTCLTGPTNALISSSGERSRHYSAGILVGVLALAFGLFSPFFTRLMLATPPAFIATLAGLAMLRVLQTAFVTSFKDRFSLGALISFLVTVSNISIANIGAPFWGLVFGFAGAWLLERGDFAAARAQAEATRQSMATPRQGNKTP
ncbi:MAG: benzoate/H(+) symporter BenE family transporter [Burkholderiaceae bacterium]|nr:benzoate/H(+) symporter BenE family transporter [Burkholderiaceae bacterium]